MQFFTPFYIATDYYFNGAYRFYGENYSYLLNSQNGSSILLHNDFIRQIEEKNLDEELLFKLIQRGFVEIPNGLVSCCKEKILPQFFIFDLTQACNFRCIYCFRHLEKHAATITDKNIIDISNYIIDYCKKKWHCSLNIMICFYNASIREQILITFSFFWNSILIFFSFLRENV